MTQTQSPFGVKLARGTVVRPQEHPETCSSAEQLADLAERVRARGMLPAADLFCGAGGLGLGLRDAGFEVVVGVDNDADALQTHGSLFPGMHLDWDLGEEGRVEEVAELLLDADVSLIAGGPPCQPFSKAGRSLIRDLVRTGRRPPQDVRRDLWQSFLAVVERVRPPAVLMENVPDMALEQDMMILRTMIDELERLGYGVEAEVAETSRYGVPQHRQRLILVGLRDGRSFSWPHRSWTEPPATTVLWDAISDLPDVEPGWRPQEEAPEWLPYDGPVTAFQERARAHLGTEEADRIHDHITRPVRDDDLAAFELLTSEMKYSDLPDHLKRYRDDIFDDKYKRLDKYDLARSITAHIAKDGYSYIHPEYHRTLTIREAARVQTFRDDVRFAGPPTAALKQIGNAVPPLLAEHLGSAIQDALDADVARPWSTREVSASLAEWFTKRVEPSIPWLDSPSRWAAAQAEILLHRARAEDIRHVWPVLHDLATPERTLDHASGIRRLGRRLDRSSRAETLLAVAERFHAEPELLESVRGMRQAGVPPAAAEMTARIKPNFDEDPVIASTPVLRVAARFTGRQVDVRNRRSEGRMAVARMVGIDPEEEGARIPDVGHRAHLALIEIAHSVCLPSRMDCDTCPLSSHCAYAQTASPPPTGQTEVT